MCIRDSSLAVPCSGANDTKRRTRRRSMRTLRLGLVVAAAALTAVSLTLWSSQTQADQKPKAKVTRYEVDGTWPKPFPTTPDPTTGRARTWIPGEVAGTCVDSRDNVCLLTRGNLLDNEVAKGTPAPPVMEFDSDGNVVAAWGNRNVLPNGIHGCFVDYQDNICLL